MHRDTRNAFAAVARAECPGQDSHICVFDPGECRVTGVGRSLELEGPFSAVSKLFFQVLVKQCKYM